MKDIRHFKRDKGSITVEASIVFPIFICVIISIIFLIKAVVVHEIIQHAANQAAHELSTVSYLFHASGLQEAHDLMREGLESDARLLEEHARTVLDTCGDITLLGEASVAIGEAMNDPQEEIKSIGSIFAQYAFEGLKTEACVPAVKHFIKNYLELNLNGDVDKRLRELNIKDGFNGLDFSLSSFFNDDNNNIDIVVAYTLDIPVPIKVISGLPIIQRATAKAWLGGDDTNWTADSEYDEESSGNDDVEEDIWSLGNFERGRKLRTIFGANLPFSFPEISAFEAGTAILIKSMDITASSYQSTKSVRDRVDGLVDNLAAYQGQEKPWGRDRIIIKRSEIMARQLVLVIPENPAAPGVNEVLQECVEYASSKGVRLKIVKYGVKRG
jgi:hypothetical protein